MVKRILAIGFILLMSSAAWWSLALQMNTRTLESSSAMSDAVGELWGSEHTQVAPQVYAEWVAEKHEEMTEKEKTEYIKRKLEEENLRDKLRQQRKQPPKSLENDFFRKMNEKHQEPVELSGSDIRVGLDLDYRKKGLLWFSTYRVDFKADYQIENPKDFPVTVRMVFPFPSPNAVYDNMTVLAPGRSDLRSTIEHEDKQGGNQMVVKLQLQPKENQLVKFSYRSRGLDQWSYQFGKDTEVVKKFKLVMQTNFKSVDFPRDSISPDENVEEGEGRKLTWNKDSIISAFQIGMVMPALLNPGPLASAMSEHAPVSLLFFFFMIFILQVMRGIKIHPLNYFFLAASFFSFNLLFSYLVDHLDIELAFVISSAVSIFLAISYLLRLVGTRFALMEAGISQFIFQILFSLAHFFKGYTGLTITIGAILTLAAVMLLTAKVDWEEVFKDRGRPKMPVPKLGGSDAPPKTELDILQDR
jgi:hypothetical protein